ERALLDVEDDVIGREERRLAVLRGRFPVVAQRLDVVREEVPREGEAPRAEAAQDLLRRDAEREDEAFAFRHAETPVAVVRLELEAPPGLELRDAERPRADAAAPPGVVERVGPLRHDRGRRVREERGEEGDRLLEVDRELVRRDDPEALE